MISKHEKNALPRSSLLAGHRHCVIVHISTPFLIRKRKVREVGKVDPQTFLQFFISMENVYFYLPYFPKKNIIGGNIFTVLSC